MSRRRINSSTVIGWDNPLQTFFLHIYDEDDELVRELGWNVKELPTVEALQVALPDIALSESMRALLKQDQAASEPLTDHQKHMLRFLHTLS